MMKMHSLLTLVCCCTAILCNSFLLPIRVEQLIATNRLFAGSLEGELDSFFETASLIGSKNSKKMLPEERALMAARGSALEDEIYDLRDRLLELENSFMALSGSKEDAIANIKEELVKEIRLLRDEINGLKDDYIQIVGGQGLPFHFGQPLQ